jgi:hypothetical protein
MLDPVTSSAIYMQITCALLRHEDVESVSHWSNHYTIHVREATEDVRAYLEGVFIAFSVRNPLLSYTLSSGKIWIDDKDILDFGPVS